MAPASVSWVAIAALPRIRRAHPGATLTVAGEGTQQEWLVEQARKYKVLKATQFVGRLDHDDLLAALHRADAAVLPSHYEPFGLAALEAAAAGTPLVTSNIGGLGEAVINGETGMSCPPRDGAGAVLERFGAAIAAAPGLRRLVYYSTIGVYGDHGGAWIDETSATRTRTARRRLSTKSFPKWTWKTCPSNRRRYGSSSSAACR